MGLEIDITHRLKAQLQIVSSSIVSMRYEVFSRMNLPLALDVNNVECLGWMVVNVMKFKLLSHPLGLCRTKCVASIVYLFIYFFSPKQDFQERS